MTREEMLKDREIRRAFTAARHPCPACLEPGLLALGGRGSCWLECKCGVFSPMSPTWGEALTDVENWQEVEPELNAAMHPPVGCP
jgi:hypothetical protein